MYSFNYHIQITETITTITLFQYIHKCIQKINAKPLMLSMLLCRACGTSRGPSKHLTKINQSRIFRCISL